MLIAIGDTHGRDNWKKIINQHIDDVDKFVFVGDYFDSFDIGPEQQMSNFLDIIEFKKNNIEKVDLLIGNHDFHYLYIDGSIKQYSGYQELRDFDIHHLLDENKKYLQLATQYNDEYLFTHAGVTQTWASLVGIDPTLPIPELVVQLNDVLEFQPKKLDFNSGIDRYSDPYGNNHFQSPIWVRPPSLTFDGLENVFQVVGHTGQSTIMTKFEGFAFIDTMERDEYLIIDDENKLITGKIEK